MAGEVAAAALQGGAVAGQGIMGYFSAKEANRMNYKLAHEGMQHEIDMWNMQNAYNTPQAQMERLKQAGLNPNLMYGQGNVGNATAAPKAHIPQHQEELSKLNIPMALEIMSKLTDMKKTIQDTETGRYQAEFNERLRTEYLNEMLENKELFERNKAWKMHHESGQAAWKEGYLADTFNDRVSLIRNQAKLAGINAQLASELKPYYMSIGDGALARLSLWLYNNLDKWFPQTKSKLKKFGL